MFTLKKILTLLILPPGLFIVLALLLGVRMLRRRVGYGVLVIGLAGLIYLLSINPVADALLEPLEKDWQIPQKISGDVIILLGGGVIFGVPDLSGRGFPSSGTLARLVTAIRLHRALGAPIIVSGGRVFGGGQAEAPVAKRIMVDLGVPAEQIIVEDRSRDTMENARFTKEICQQAGFHQPILVTSALHMRRSLIAFKKAGLPVTPFPVDFRVAPGHPKIWADYFPDLGALGECHEAIHEYLGIWFYKFAY